jgi:phosphoglycolate phosphatase
MTAVLLWDVDGTLLTTRRAGVFALEEALVDVTGRPADLTGVPTAGLTDVEIAWAILERAGAGPTEALVARFLRAYEARLPACLPRRAGHVMPNVKPILEAFGRRPDVVSLLLTGNTRAGALAKLRHYGLDAYLSDGAFAETARERESIARAAFALARARVPGLGADALFVIGDTPHDVRCGRAIGARVVAVASGGHPIEELRRHGPWLALEALPGPDEFARRLGLDGAGASGEGE